MTFPHTSASRPCASHTSARSLADLTAHSVPRALLTLVAAAAVGTTAFAPAHAQDATQSDMQEAGETMDEGMTTMDAPAMEAPVTDAPLMESPVVDAPMVDGPTGMVVREPVPAPAPVVRAPSDTPMTPSGMTAPEMASPEMAAEGEVTRVEVACPEGTTAQPDGTCLMDGDTLPE